jgi:hypothetical protein
MIGLGDPTNQKRLLKVTLKEASTHLMKYAVMHPTRGELYYPFMEHERFVFYANDRDRRHRLLDQSNVFLKQHAAYANHTLEELQDLAKSGCLTELMSAMMAYSANITGSDPYWWARRRELEALFSQKLPGTVFFTLSYADNWVYEMHRLLPGGVGGRSSTAVNRNAHVAEWWFSECLEKFVGHFFKKVCQLSLINSA